MFNCPTCHTQITQPSNFCAVCGTRIVVAPVPTPGSGSEVSGEPYASSPVAPSDAAPDSDNVVYLRDHQHGEGAPADAGAAQGAPPPTGMPIGVDPHAAAEGYEWSTNVLGERVRVPVGTVEAQPMLSSYDEHDGESKIVGTMVAATAGVVFAGGLLVYALALRNGSGGADAGAFVLAASMLWIWYLSLDPSQQHRRLVGAHRRTSNAIDRRIVPLRSRTERQLGLRRERDRAMAMRRERSRRVSDLGEAAYRLFRAGTLDADLASHGQRVLSIEQQMLLQDQRVSGLLAPPAGPGPEAGADRPPQPGT
jgi:hypothetical protein